MARHTTAVRANENAVVWLAVKQLNITQEMLMECKKHVRKKETTEENIEQRKSRTVISSTQSATTKR